MQYDAFLSYASEDREVAEAVAVTLRGHGLRVFLDESELTPTSSLAHELEDAMRSSRMVVLLLPCQSSWSRWVSEELAYALRAQKIIIPIARHPEDLDSPLGTLIADHPVEIVPEWNPRKVALAVERAVFARAIFAKPRRARKAIVLTCVFLVAFSFLAVAAGLLRSLSDAKARIAAQRANLEELSALLEELSTRDAERSTREYIAETVSLRNAALLKRMRRGEPRSEAHPDAFLPYVDLRYARLESWVLDRAVLLSAKLGNANLEGAYLRGAVLAGADLREADLSAADLAGADLTAADLRGADLRGADLDGAKLDAVDARGALYDEATSFPESFDPVAASMVRE